MADDEIKPDAQALTLVFWLSWAARQGIAIVVLIGVTVAMGYYLAKLLPERDAAWAKAMETQATENRALVKAVSENFTQELDARDKRFIEYRSKADERFTKAMTDLLAAKDRDIDRVVTLLTSRINDVQKHSESTAKKVDSLMN